MLRSTNGIMGYEIAARDGEIGRCKDLLFDDIAWTVRYLVADTGNWLPGRRVLVSPISLGDPDWASRQLPVRLTKEQVQEAPSLEEHAPVSRQYEIAYSRYYGWPHYWGGSGLWGESVIPGPLYSAGEAIGAQEAGAPADGDVHLRSTSEVTGYHIKAEDGEIGHVEDFILEDDTWAIRYLAVDTRNWLPGRKVLVSPLWIDSVSWSHSQVEVGLTRRQIQESPEYDPKAPVNREYETRLYDYYGRPVYWE